MARNSLKAIASFTRLRQVQEALSDVEDIPEGTMDAEDRGRVVALRVLTRCKACPHRGTRPCPLHEALLALDSRHDVLQAAAALKEEEAACHAR
jgi:hypothetical protein